MIMCRIKDAGRGFSLDAYDPIRHSLFREKQGLRPGGYGVLIAKHLVDELVYAKRAMKFSWSNTFIRTRCRTTA